MTPFEAFPFTAACRAALSLLLVATPPKGSRRDQLINAGPQLAYRPTLALSGPPCFAAPEFPRTVFRLLRRPISPADLLSWASVAAPLNRHRFEFVPPGVKRRQAHGAAAPVLWIPVRVRGAGSGTRALCFTVPADGPAEKVEDLLSTTDPAVLSALRSTCAGVLSLNRRLDALQEHRYPDADFAEMPYFLHEPNHEGFL